MSPDIASHNDRIARLCQCSTNSDSFFTALNNGAVSAAISFLRTFVFQIVIVLILPKLIGITGVWLSIVLAEFLALFVTIGFLIAKRKKYHYA